MGWTGRRASRAAAVALLGVVLVGCNPSVVSINHEGTDAGDGPATDPVVSPDGTMVAFVSDASNLVPGMPEDPHHHIYVRDLVAGNTELVSESTGGELADRPAYAPVFSPDGTKVVFHSTAGNLTPQSSLSPYAQLYIRDLVAGTTEMVSVDAAGTGRGDHASYAGYSFSPDGTQIVFTSGAGNLGPTDTSLGADIYVRDLVTDTTTLVSRNAAGTSGGNFVSQDPVFTPEGTRVAYNSFATDLGPVDTNRRWDAYITDLATGTTTLLSQNAAATGSGNDHSWLLDLTPDGSAALISSYAGDLVAGTPDDALWDYFLRDLTTGTTTRIAALGLDATQSYDFSPDGRYLAFTTDSGSLGPTDTVVTCQNSDVPPRDVPCPDVYLHDRSTGTTTLVSVNAAGTNGGNSASSAPRFSPDGSRLLFGSGASDLGPVDTNGTADLYISDMDTGEITLVTTRQDGSDSADGASFLGQFGQDERTVIFQSTAEDMGPGPDANGHPDIYLKALPED